MAKKKMGRPSKYLPEYCDKLIYHMKKGRAFESFAGEIGVCFDTLYEWAKGYPEFMQAKKVGQAASFLWWDTQGSEGLYKVTTSDGAGGTSTVSLNSAVYCFNMKNRFGWRDKQDVEVEAKVKTESADSGKVDELVKLIKKSLVIE